VEAVCGLFDTKAGGWQTERKPKEMKKQGKKDWKGVFPGILAPGFYSFRDFNCS
jgi:hypothetical protein